jgi:hypothetical protein
MLIGSFKIDPEMVRNLVVYLFDKFIMEKSIYPIAFKNLTTMNFISEFEQIMKSQKFANLIEVRIEINENFNAIEFPKYYYEKALEEILSNLRHSDMTKKISIKWYNEGEFVVMKTQNFVKLNTTNIEEQEIGSGKGIDMLKRINNYPVLSKYQLSESSNSFIQELKFKSKIL